MMNKTILISDDSESVRELVKLSLVNAGYSVIQSIDGLDTISKLDGQEINLIITDLNMPNLDGIGVVKKVRQMEKYRYVPILLLTTESQLSKKEEAKKAGATGWIVKPFVADKLIAVIKKVIR